MLSLLALVLLALVLIQNPKIQTKITKYFTNNLSKSWGTKVEIGEVNIDFFSQLNIKNLYIEDFEGDTLLYASTLHTKIKRFAPFQNTLTLTDSKLDSVILRIERSSTDTLSNFEHVFSKNSKSPQEEQPSKKKKKKKKTPFNFSFEDIEIDYFEFKNIDSLKQSYTEVSTSHFSTYFRTFNLKRKKMSLDYLNLYEPSISLNNLDKVSTGNGVDTTTFTLPKDWILAVNKLSVKAGDFINHGTRKTAGKENILSFGYFDWHNFNVDAQDLHGENNQLNFTINHIEFVDDTGFEVDDFSGKGYINPDDIHVTNLHVKTPQSSIEGDLNLTYNQFKNFSDFENKIYLNADIRNITLAPKDFKILFGTTPVTEPVHVKGSVEGEVSNLSAKDFELEFEHGSVLRADVEARGLPDLPNTFFDAQITELNTTQSGLRKIIGKRELPEQITRFGDIDFHGDFVGYLSEFIAYGNLASSIGDIETDIKFSSKDISNPTYSGLIELNDFQLGYWLDNKDLGNVSLSASVNGSNFDLAKMDVTFDATIEEVGIQDRMFTQIDAAGSLKQNILDAELNSDNELFSGSIDGVLDFSNPEAHLQFESNIKHADLRALGFFDSQFEVKGIIQADLTGESMDNLKGGIDVSQAKILSNGKQYDFKEDLSLSIKTTDDIQQVTFLSENAKIEFTGKYNYTQLLPTFEKTINQYYDFEQGWDRLQNTIETDQDIGFTLDIKKEDQLTKLFFSELQLNSDINVEGEINPKYNTLSLLGHADSLTWNKYTVTNWQIDAIGDGSVLVINSFQDEILNREKIWLTSSEINVELSRNEILADLRTYNEEFLSAKLTSRIKRDGKAFVISFLTSDFIVNGQKWQIQEGNSLTLGAGDWEAKNFTLQNGEQKITIINPPGDNATKLSANLEQLSVVDMNQLINFTQKPVGGRISGDINLIDYEQNMNLDLSLSIDSLMYNQDVVDFTTIDGLYNFDNQKAVFDGITFDEDFKFGITAELDLKKQEDILYLTIDIDHSSLKPFEHLYGDALSDMQGDVNGIIQIAGGPTKFRLLGDVKIIDDVFFTLNFTQARYKIPKGQSLTFQNDGFVLNYLKLYDSYNHEAIFNGKISHENLNNFTLNIVGNYENFLFLNTTERDNDVLWGKAFASGDLSFKGPVNNAVLAVNASSNDNTEIFIANSSSKNTGEYGFLRFKEPVLTESEEQEQQAAESRSKLTMNFNLEISPNAEVDIRIDEEGYNTIHGSGYGNLEVILDTEDLLQIFGIYEIYNGEYLVNYKDIFEKPFNIQPGSVIQWSGDPFNARIDINATYTLDADLRALSESASAGGSYLANAETKVNVNLGNTLPEPVFKYNIEVDKAEVGSSVAEQLSYINNNKALLDQQIGSLLFLNQFSSVNSDPFSSQRASDIAINSVTNILTKQLTTLFNESGIFKNTTIGIDYNDFRSNYVSESVNENFGYDKNIELQLTQRFLNDRIEVEVGSDINFGESLGSNVDTFQVGDFIFSYRIDERGNYKLLLFSKRDYSILLNQEQRRYGFGFVIQREFNNFKEFFASDKKKKEEPVDSMDLYFPPAVDSIQIDSDSLPTQ